VSTASPTARTAPLWTAAAADAASVLVFAVAGIASHDGSMAAALGRVVWPFALAAALGWVLTRAWHDPARIWPTGVLIWLVTVVGGLALRGVSGQGLAWTFVLVTTLFLALTMLGWRALLAAGLRRRHPSGLSQAQHPTDL
jgi:Na+/melibiose symporter-like transporter